MKRSLFFVVALPYFSTLGCGLLAASETEGSPSVEHPTGAAVPPPISEKPIFLGANAQISALSRDGMRIAWTEHAPTGARTLKVRDLSNHKDESVRALCTLRSTGNIVLDSMRIEASFSDDGRLLAYACSNFDSKGSSSIYVANEGQAPRALNATNIRSFRFWPGRELLLMVGEKGLETVDPQTGLSHWLSDVPNNPGTLGDDAFSPDGRHIVFMPTGGSAVRIYTLETGINRLIPADGYTFEGMPRFVNADRVVVGGEGNILFWNLSTEQGVLHKRSPESLYNMTGSAHYVERRSIGAQNVDYVSTQGGETLKMPGTGDVYVSPSGSFLASVARTPAEPRGITIIRTSDREKSFFPADTTSEFGYSKSGALAWYTRHSQQQCGTRILRFNSTGDAAESIGETDTCGGAMITDDDTMVIVRSSAALRTFDVTQRRWSSVAINHVSFAQVAGGFVFTDGNQLQRIDATATGVPTTLMPAEAGWDLAITASPDPNAGHCCSVGQAPPEASGTVVFQRYSPPNAEGIRTHWELYVALLH